MKNIYIPKNFSVKEFVSREVYTSLGESSWWLLNPNIVYTMDKLRDYFGKPVTINSWDIGGTFEQRGFRDDSSVGARYSQHKFGNAADFSIVNYEAEEVRKKILALSKGYFNGIVKYISAMESDTNWVHIDCRPATWDGIKVFKP